MTKTEPKDGIYFDLPEGEYHALERMSASHMKNMLISAPTFWAESWLNKDRKHNDDDTPARILGRAYHCAMLEGDQLHKRFIGKPDFDAMDGVLQTDAAVCRELKDRGETQKMKDELSLDRAHRLVGCGYEGKIRSILEADFEKEAGDRQVISEPYWSDLLRDCERLKRNPAIFELVDGGASEVTILWTCPETKISMKARIDKLKADKFVDLKSFANAMRKETRQVLREAVQYNKYYLSMRHYQTAVEMIARLNLPIQKVSADSDKELVAKLKARKLPLEPWFLFQEKGGVPNMLARRLRFHTFPRGVEMQDIGAEDHEIKSHRSILAHKADMEIDHAKKQFLDGMLLYGTDQVWFGFDQLGEIGDEDFSEYFLESKPA